MAEWLHWSRLFFTVPLFPFIAGWKGQEQKELLTSLPCELAAFVFLIHFVHSRGEVPRGGDLRSGLPSIALVRRCVKESDLERSRPLPGRDRSRTYAAWVRLLRGVAKERRIFPIGNYVNQRLLRPVHDWLMRRKIPQDGTFNQTKKELVGNTLSHFTSSQPPIGGRFDDGQLNV